MNYSRLLLSSILGLFTLNNFLFAGSLGMDAEYRADYSNNTFQEENSDEIVEELTHNYRLSFYGESNGSKSQSLFIANLEYIDYQDDTAEDIALTSFIGSSEIAITARAFSWVFVDALGYFDSNPTLSINRRDQERVNFFLTGPRFRHVIDSNTEVGTRFFYTNQDRNGSDEDYNQLNFSAYWDRAFSLRDSWGIELESTTRQYVNNDFRSDYSISEINTYYRRGSLSNSYGLLVGVALLESDDGDEEEISGNFNFDWDHLFTRRTGSVLNASFNLRDESVLATSALTTTGLFEQDDESGLFYETTLGTRLYNNSVYSDIDFGIVARRLEYIDSEPDFGTFDIDHDTYSVYSNYRRFFGATTAIGFSVEFEQKNYFEDDFEESLVTTSIDFSRELGRTLSFEIDFELLQGKSNVPRGNAASEDREFNEFLLSIGMQWEPYRSRNINREGAQFFDLGLINQ